MSLLKKAHNHLILWRPLLFGRSPLLLPLCCLIGRGRGVPWCSCGGRGALPQSLLKQAVVPELEDDYAAEESEANIETQQTKACHILTVAQGQLASPKEYCDHYAYHAKCYRDSICNK